MKTKKENKLTEAEAKELGGTIGHLTNLMYLMARCIDTVSYDIESRMKRVNATLCIQGEVKRRLKEYTGKVRDCSVHFENFIEPKISESAKGDWQEIERTRVYANELIRLLMMYYEKCTNSDANHAAVFDLLDSFKDGVGVFSNKDINRFDLGCK